MSFPVPRSRAEGRWPDEIAGLVAQVDEVMGNALADLRRTVRDVVPLTDVEERDDAYVLDVELPGVRRDDVQVEVAQGRLTVVGERRGRQRVGLLRHRTRTTGRFRLDLTLPLDVDADAVSASLDHGVLTVVVPKAVHARRRRIPVTRR